MKNLVKKLIPSLLILVILTGVFAPVTKIGAQNPPTTATGLCYPSRGGTAFPSTPDNCRGVGNFVPYNNTNNPAPTTPTTLAEGATETPKSGNALYDSLSTCPPVSGCVGMVLYLLFYSIPSFLLAITANFFNVMVSMTIQSDLYNQATFVGNAWTVVRDLSNIFFILILLYVAIQTILGIGHETKKAIVQVILMALLINFSMFFARVVIDTSNILALVFYNKINVTLVRNDRTVDTNYIPVLRSGADKDVAGRMMGYFDPTKILTNEFFDKFRRTEYTFSVAGAGAAAAGGAIVGSWIPIVGTFVGGVVGVVGYTLSGFSNSVPIAISIGFILTAGSIIIFAAYAFLIAGLSFLARMIELWILIIFSPFAFMSSTMPHVLGNMKYIGWANWIDRLVKLSFMAPIFMFFIYLIFMIIQSNIFVSFMARTDPTKQTWMETLLFMVIPALVILILLMKATKYAKEASGELGSMVIGGAKMLTGLAVGGAALGGAQILRGSAGRFMKEASTGDTAASRMTSNRAVLADPTAGMFKKMQARIDLGRGSLAKTTGFNKLQEKIGDKINKDQKKVEHASHARHELDTEAAARFDGKKFTDLTKDERDTVRVRLSRDDLGYKKFGKKYKELDAASKILVDGDLGVNDKGAIVDATKAIGMRTSHADHLIEESKEKQGIGSTLMQASRTGSYDIRNIANVIAKEQSTGFAKIAMGLTGVMAMGIRGGFKSMGIGMGESQANFFKDLASTISESLKNVKINVDTSHIGEVKKEDGHGGGGGHH